MSDNDTVLQEQRKPDPFWLTSKPADRMCSAKTRSGSPCKKWAMNGKTRCRNHGGKSTGPTTPHITTGEQTLLSLKEKLLIQIGIAAKSEFGTVQFFHAWLEQIFPAIDYEEFRRIRPALMAFCQGRLSARLVVKIIGERKHFIS